MPVLCCTSEPCTRARAEPGNRLRGPHSREPRRADVTTWQMLLSLLACNCRTSSSSSTTQGPWGTLSLLLSYLSYGPAHVFPVDKSPRGCNQSNPVARFAPAITNALEARARATFFSLEINSRPDQKSPIVIGNHPVYPFLLLRFMLPCSSSGVPALFRKEFMVSWRALGT